LNSIVIEVNTEGLMLF